MSEVALYNGMNENELLAAMGMQPQQSDEQESTGNLLPILKVNYQEEDDEGNELKKGAFALTLPTGTVYGKDVRVRVYADYMQYLNYDPVQEAVVNKTIIHRVGDEAIDEQGGVRCGKPTSKDLREMDEETQQKWRSVTCFRYLYSTVTIADATLADGTKAEVKDVPCLFRMKTGSFMAFNSVLEATKSQRLKFTQVESVVKTVRKKRGSVNYFVIEIHPDMSNIREITGEDFAFMSKILETVNGENKRIIAKHNNALRAKQTDADDEKVVAEVEDYLDADFVEAS